MTASRTPTDTGTIVTTPVRSPVGDVCIAVRDETVVACGFADRWDGLARKVKSRFPEASWERGESTAGAALRDYIAGDLGALDGLVVDRGGTAFQQRVWDALRHIPVGETWTYAELAEAVGTHGASRAVGSANGANPVSLVVPCHRVIRADGTLGGYGGGLDRKSWLLAHEGAMLVG